MIFEREKEYPRSRPVPWRPDATGAYRVAQVGYFCALNRDFFLLLTFR